MKQLNGTNGIVIFSICNQLLIFIPVILPVNIKLFLGDGILFLLKQIQPFPVQAIGVNRLRTFLCKGEKGNKKPENNNKSLSFYIELHIFSIIEFLLNLR